MKSILFAPMALSLAFVTPLAAQEWDNTDSENVEASDDAADTRVAIEPTRGWNPADWELEDSEFTPEAGWVFGKLDNGVRYIIRRNDRPENTALVRMEIDAGAIDETDEERGYAHYVEHMAFNGSTNVPEGEMVKLLERLGLAFGADTNASTGFDRTQYKLNLPKADPKLLDTALMLMRETVSELTFDEEAVQREKGVVLSERRVRNNYALKNIVDSLEFAYPESRISQRLPIGTAETLDAANAEKLRAFWQREYVPADTVVVVVGDFDAALVEAKIAERFGDWLPATSPDQPAAGPVDPAYAGKTDIYLDPALTESIAILRHQPFVERPDTVEERRKNLLRQVASSIVGRRLQRLQRSEDPLFRGVNVSNSEFFETVRTTQLSIATEEGGWKRGLEAAIDEYRRALIYGFTKTEIAEQLSNGRNSIENAVANTATRTNGSFESNAFDIARGEGVPDSPEDRLARFEEAVPGITPEAVLAVMREDFTELENPLIRFAGKTAPEGGAEALRKTVMAAFQREVAPPEDAGVVEFEYTDFGKPGGVVADTRTDDLGIREIRFDNGVRLNLKPTDLSDDRISIRIAVDGGELLQTRDNPLAVELTGLLTSGGLGKHSRDELQTILAGRSVGGSLGTSSETFSSSLGTTPRDFQLQLQLMAAYLTDPGYRAEGLGPYSKSLDDFFAQLGKTPDSAYSEAVGPLLSDGDPRFSRQPVEAYRALDYAMLKDTISDRLANGAIEIGIVGDFDEDEAIRYVSETFGALPKREPEFRAYDDERRTRSFTSNRGLHVFTHQGEPDQAMIRMIWPTTDDEDWELSSRLSLLARVVRLKLTDKLREELGQTYSPSAGSGQSSVYRDYGTFEIGASVDVGELDATHDALVETIAELIATTPDDDVLQRARQPLLESLENRLKSNGGWMGLVDRAQSKPDDIERFQTAQDRYKAITGAELQALARQYLDPAKAVEIRVVPEEATE